MQQVPIDICHLGSLIVSFKSRQTHEVASQAIVASPSGLSLSYLFICLFSFCFFTNLQGFPHLENFNCFPFMAKSASSLLFLFVSHLKTNGDAMQCTTSHVTRTSNYLICFKYVHIYQECHVMLFDAVIIITQMLQIHGFTNGITGHSRS